MTTGYKIEKICISAESSTDSELFKKIRKRSFDRPSNKIFEPRKKISLNGNVNSLYIPVDLKYKILVVHMFIFHKQRDE